MSSCILQGDSQIQPLASASSSASSSLVDRTCRPRPAPAPAAPLPLSESTSTTSPSQIKLPLLNSPNSLSVNSAPPGPRRHRHRIQLPKARASDIVHHDPAAAAMDSQGRVTKTGRVSKAKKGLKVHSCHHCGKVYTRAEHLRRHAHNHGESLLQCPICDKAFYRDDLLARHISKHSHSPSNGHRQMSSLGGNSSRSSERYPSNPPVSLSMSAAGFSPSLTGTVVDDAAALGTHAAIPDLSISARPLKEEPIDRPLFHPQPQPHHQAWMSEPQPYEYQGLQLSPSSSAPSPWFPACSSFSMAPTLIDATDRFSPVPTFWPGLQNPFSPASTPPGCGWDYTFMESDKLSVQTSSTSSPVPLPALAVPPTLFPTSGGNVEASLQDAHLGISLSARRKQTYIEAYFRHFHPLFPVIHVQSFRQHMQLSEEKLLSSAVMAIGAQYTDETFAGSDSRILHEKCQELIAKNKVALCSTSRLEIMQAIVLVEFLSHFKAKRAPDSLSEVFIATYDKLWHRHGMYQTKSAVDRVGIIQSHSSEEAIRHQWNEWIELHSFERLLAASFILESNQALLLVRPSHSSAGLDLLIPVATALWDAPSSTRWSALLRAHPIPVMNIFQTLEEIGCNSKIHCDPFQSALIVACYASSTTLQLQDTMDCMTGPTHAMFEPSNHSLLSRALAPQSSVLIMHHAVHLISCTPLRALIATSGETWFFSQKLAGDAETAAAEFERLQLQLRAWTNLTAPSAPSSSFGIPPTNTPFADAVSSALAILKLATTTSLPHSTLAFGPEMAIYFAALVLWAATYAAIIRAEANGSTFPQDDETAEFEPPRAEELVKQWLPLAVADVNASTSSDNPALPLCIPPVAVLDSWRVGVGGVVRWTAWVLGGAGQRASGAGELVEGAVGVLEKLGRSGFVASESWF